MEWPLKSNSSFGDRSGQLISDVDKVNEYFANISFDPLYHVNNVNALRRSDQEHYEKGENHPLYSYEVETALSEVTKTSPGPDNIPCWVFKDCSFELADVVTHIFNCSLKSIVLFQTSGVQQSSRLFPKPLTCHTFRFSPYFSYSNFVSHS